MSTGIKSDKNSGSRSVAGISLHEITADSSGATARAISAALEKKDPLDVIRWALARSRRPVLTTNFGPYEAAILHACTRENPDITVLWCDTGYNTTYTYLHAKDLIEKLNLRVHVYAPLQTAAYRSVFVGLPSVDDPAHALFTEQVKLEPFRRAIKELRPDLWISNIRAGQTSLRASLGMVSAALVGAANHRDGIVKVSPFYRYDDAALDAYLKQHNLPNESRYFDPTKVVSGRECGLHAL